jgi:hypothetical protein
MKSNVGGIDRILRIVVGLVLIALALTGTIGAWGWIGVVPLAHRRPGLLPAVHGAGLEQLPAQEALSHTRRRNDNSPVQPGCLHLCGTLRAPVNGA